MKSNLFKKSCTSMILASTFLMLTACGGGGSSDVAADPEPEVGSAEWIEAVQAELDADGNISTFDDEIFNSQQVIETAGLTFDGVIDSAEEIAAIQGALDAIDSPTSL
ncbi:MAG: hypothetical protein GQ475_07665 [Methylococcaceae bacterium]|nr:hypothetical protein [Methylococcaceae bacterium]